MRVRLSLWALIMALVGTIGCGGKKEGGPPTANDRHAFDGAAQGMKEMWDEALKADEANDYSKAETLLYALVRPEITPEQRAAVTRRLTSVTQRLDEGLVKGDPGAKAALDELRRNPPNRQQH